MPTHGPKTAENRPASPPATIRRMSAGESHLGTRSVVGGALDLRRELTWRSSPAGRLTACQIARRTSSLLQPPAASVSACSGQMTNSVADPSGHQFGLQSVAAAQPSAAASSSGVRLRCSEIESGASPASIVTAEAPAGSPRSTCSGGHGLRASSSARQHAQLAGLAQGRTVEPPRHALAGERHEQPQRAADGEVAAGARAERAHAGIEAAASRTGPLTTAIWPAGWVVTAWPCRLNSGLSIASAAAADHREVLGPAAGQNGAGCDALERRLPHPRRHRAERPVRIAAGEHRRDTLRRRRDRRQAVRPAELVHRLGIVVGSGGVRGELPRVVRRLGGAAGLPQRRLRRQVDPHQLGERGGVPADDRADHLAGRADRDRGRHSLEPIGAQTSRTAPAPRASALRSLCGAPAVPPRRDRTRRRRSPQRRPPPRGAGPAHTSGSRR